MEERYRLPWIQAEIRAIGYLTPEIDSESEATELINQLLQKQDELKHLSRCGEDPKLEPERAIAIKKIKALAESTLDDLLIRSLDFQ